MKEETERADDEIFEEGGVLEDWSPINEKHRTEASPVQRAYERFREKIQERFEPLQRRREEAGRVRPWEPLGEEQWRTRSAQ